MSKFPFFFNENKKDIEGRESRVRPQDLPKYKHFSACAFSQSFFGDCAESRSLNFFCMLINRHLSKENVD